MFTTHSLLQLSGLSPFEASLGYKPPLFQEQETEIAVPYNITFSATVGLDHGRGRPCFVR